MRRPPHPLRCYICGEQDPDCTCWSTTLTSAPAHHRQWLKTQLGRILHGYHSSDNVDNLRFAPADDMDAVREYTLKQHAGCCGEADHLLRHPDGTVYMVGFNYGH